MLIVNTDFALTASKEIPVAQDTPQPNISEYTARIESLEIQLKERDDLINKLKEQVNRKPSLPAQEQSTAASVEGETSSVPEPPGPPPPPGMEAPPPPPAPGGITSYMQIKEIVLEIVTTRQSLTMLRYNP
jgi:hypothetical protein